MGRWFTHISRRHLSQINRVIQVLVAHTIFVPVRPLPLQRGLLNQIPHVTLEIHFQVDAHAPIERRKRAKDINVRDTYFDNLGLYFASLLVGCNTDFGLVVAGIHLSADGTGEAESTGLGELVESVTLSLVYVVHGYP